MIIGALLLVIIVPLALLFVFVAMVFPPVGLVLSIIIGLFFGLDAGLKAFCVLMVCSLFTMLLYKAKSVAGLD